MGLLSRYTAALMLVMWLVIAGCTPIAWTRVMLNHPLGVEDVAFIKPGETKWDEVIRRLGAPNDLSETPSGMVATYYYYDGKRFQVDFGYPLGFFPPASYVPHEMDFSNEGIGGNRFQVAFDTNGTVRYEGFSHVGAVPRFTGSPFESSIP